MISTKTISEPYRDNSIVSFRVWAQPMKRVWADDHELPTIVSEYINNHVCHGAATSKSSYEINTDAIMHARITSTVLEKALNSVDQSTSRAITLNGTTHVPDPHSISNLKLSVNSQRMSQMRTSNMRTTIKQVMFRHMETTMKPNLTKIMRGQHLQRKFTIF